MKQKNSQNKQQQQTKDKNLQSGINFMTRCLKEEYTCKFKQKINTTTITK